MNDQHLNVYESASPLCSEKNNTTQHNTQQFSTPRPLVSASANQ